MSVISVALSSNDSWLCTVKSSSPTPTLWRWRRISSTWTVAASISFSSLTWTLIWLIVVPVAVRLRESRAMAVVIGTITWSSWLPMPVPPLASNTPITLKLMLLMRMFWPIAS